MKRAWFSPRTVSGRKPQDTENKSNEPGREPARVGELPCGQFLRHVKHQPPVGFFDTSHKTAELVQEAGFLTVTTPDNIISGFALGEVWKFGRLFAVIEKLIEWNLEGAG